MGSMVKDFIEILKIFSEGRIKANPSIQASDIINEEFHQLTFVNALISLELIHRIEIPDNLIDEFWENSMSLSAFMLKLEKLPKIDDSLFPAKKIYDIYELTTRVDPRKIIVEMFNDLEMIYDENKEESYFFTLIRTNIGEYQVSIDYSANTNEVVLSAYLQLKVPEEKKYQCYELLNLINKNIQIGKFFIESNGIIIYTITIFISPFKLNPLEEFLRYSVTTLDNWISCFSEVISSDKDANEIFEEHHQFIESEREKS